MQRNTFPKEEHLCGKDAITALFTDGEKFFLYPLKVTFLTVSEGNVPVRCLVSAPKKRFKRAVDRNRIKRQLREAYRKNKHPLHDLMNERGIHLDLSLNYVGEKVEPSAFVEKKVKAAIGKLVDKLSVR